MTPLRFDNRFIRDLPGDPSADDVPRQVQGACWSAVHPTPVATPRLLAHSREVARLVGLSEADVQAAWFPRVFGGNELLPGMQPYAACYGGHQFGNWAGQLGDGRAITLGEAINDRGERWELQLKGAGPTPYSRRADGRAVLRSSIREFLCSEAMHHLGVPTTRALSVVTTGDQVLRDMFYDGNAALEPGAIVCRVAPSFIRFGNFEIFASRGEHGILGQLVDLTIARDFPHLAGDAQEKRAAWFAEVCERTARMIVHWMRVGFVHGVMNTDNMSILGLTIDYGPYGWLDDYDPEWTPNTTDAQGRRYRYSQQPAVAQWNLLRLADALQSQFEGVGPLQAGIDRFAETFGAGYEAMIAAKFGFVATDESRSALVQEAFNFLYHAEMDYTLFFRALGSLPAVVDAEGDATMLLGDVFYDEAKRDAHRGAISDWLRRWRAATMPAVESPGAPDALRLRMDAVNPKYVLRNYLAQQAIDLATAGDPSMVETLLEVMRRPYDEQPEHAHLAARRPEWARHRAGCSMLSCSS
ncbi:MAG: YdiU family protein [Gemmatimonadaceae bacterium]|nr:YdiU family protein [Gemmatimonadaceae bacterium]